MTFRSTTLRRIISSFKAGFTRITYGYVSLRFRFYDWRMLLRGGMEYQYSVGFRSREGFHSYRYSPRIPCYLAWNWGRLRRCWRGYVSRYPVRYWLLCGSLICLLSLYFMPSSSQFAYIEAGVGLWQRVFCKVNLILLIPLWALARRLR